MSNWFYPRDAGVQAPYTGFTRDTIFYLVHEVPMSMAMAGNLDITKTKDRKYCTDLVSSKTQLSHALITYGAKEHALE